MWRSLFLSSTSLVTAGAALVTGCSSGNDCGPTSATAFGLTASSSADQISLVYGNLMSGANNDCPDPAAPSGVVSLTISGTEMGGAGLITFCVPRPDLLTGGLTLGLWVHVVDLTGADASCTYALDTTQPPTGDVTGHGVCSNGTDPAGFGMMFDNGTVPVHRTCGATVDNVQLTLSGDVAVKPQ
jgi:hypothetical protein